MVWDVLDAMIHRQVVAGGGRASVEALGGWPIFRYDIPGRGLGAPVVLVHGLAGDTHNFFTLFEGLRDLTRRVLAFDFPGHGRSPLLTGRDPPPIEEQYELLRMFLREVVCEPAVLVGNSLGGALVAHATYDAPSVVLGSMLLAPAGAHVDDEGYQGLKRLFQGSTYAEVRATVHRMMHRTIPGTGLVVPHFKKRFSAPAVQLLLANGYRPLDPALLGSIRQPVTFVWGRSEKILPADGYHWFQRHLPPHSRVVLLDRCGHVPQLEHPDRVLSLLEDLIDAV